MTMNRKINNSWPLLLAFILGGIFQSCKEDDVVVTAKTYHAEQVTATSGTIRCTVAVEGGKLKESGLCFSTTNTAPKITDSRIILSTSSLTDFTIQLSGLTTDSLYRYRAYAILGDDTYYGYTYTFRPVNPTVDLVLVQGGRFQMGATQEQTSYAVDDEKPLHWVTLSNFRMDRYEVTTKAFTEFLNSRKITDVTTCMTASGVSKTIFYETAKNIYYHSNKWYPASGYENKPMTNVTWYGADEYCRWAGGFLPTEAQWEYAARGGAANAGAIYSGGNDPTAVAWYNANTNNQEGVEYYAQNVGGKTANELGLYDMSGNVWEWCRDWFVAYSSTEQVNPTGLTDEQADDASVTTKVRRGGGWAETNVNKLRVSFRGANTPLSYAGSVGFRMAAME